ncbi:MBL fold metallo-hydrolase [Desertivirga xinjiangensis]|uniref:MBL fold metallo-hydrolase n=1 Tax=Desertivirga xinjiangensis TaxID=539206 RepID=UPI00210C8D24|nr:MBL fold metallo-hydrolase [Pedobacter xinjiangensis]
MERRQFIRTAGLSLGLLGLLQNNAYSEFFKRAYNLRLLRRNVGIFTEQGGTIAWLVNKEGIVVVDSQFPEPAGHLISELKKQSEKPFKCLINTHHHGDHTSGNIAFKGLVSEVIAHDNALKNLKRVAEEQKTEDKMLFPSKTFKDDMDLRVGDENIKLYYFGPGHTNGDALIHFTEANIIHVGDLVFNRRFPFIDRPGGASIRSWIKVLDRTLKTFDKDALYVFGHALNPEKVTGDADDLKAFQNYLSRLLVHVESEIKAGKSLEEILKTKVIPGAIQWQGAGIERSLTAAYEELSADVSKP